MLKCHVTETIPGSSKVLYKDYGRGKGGSESDSQLDTWHISRCLHLCKVVGRVEKGAKGSRA